MGARIDASIVFGKGHLSQFLAVGPANARTPQTHQSDRTSPHIQPPRHQRARFRPHECETAMPLLEAIERRATRLEVPVDSRIERGRTPRHALAQLIEHERFDRIVVPAQTSRTDGLPRGRHRLAA